MLKRGRKRTIKEQKRENILLRCYQTKSRKRNILLGNMAIAKRAFSSGHYRLLQDIAAAPDAREKGTKHSGKRTFYSGKRTFYSGSEKKATYIISFQNLLIDYQLIIN